MYIYIYISIYKARREGNNGLDLAELENGRGEKKEWSGKQRGLGEREVENQGRSNERTSSPPAKKRNKEQGRTEQIEGGKKMGREGYKVLY